MSTVNVTPQRTLVTVVNGARTQINIRSPGVQGPPGDTTAAAAAAAAAAASAAAAAASAAEAAAAVIPEPPDDGAVYGRANGAWVKLVEALTLTGTLPDWTTGEVYSASLTIAGGQPPYVLDDFAVPAGFDAVIAGDRVEIIGTSSVVGAFEWAFDVSDSIGLSASITQSGEGFEAEFDPASRYEGGINGPWYDPSDLSTLFQDAAGTVPVTAIGQTVKRVNDKSGNGIHVSNAGANWTLQNDGTNNYLQTDGATRLESASFAWGSDKLSFFCAVKADTGGLSRTLCQFGAVTSQTGSWETGFQAGGLLVYRRGSGTFGGRYTANIGTAVSVLSTLLDLAGTTQATENPYVRVDGAQPSLTNAGSADSGSGNFGTYTFRLGGAGNFFAGRIYQVFGVAATSTLEQMQDGERWCASKSGVTLPFEAAPAPVFLDTGATVQESGYVRTSAFSRAVYETDATKMLVTIQSPARAAFSAMVQLGVYVDGVFHEAIAPTSTAAQSQIVNLPAGVGKVVEFVSGLQTAPTQTVPPLGTYFVGASANAPMTVVNAAPANRILIYGDSIAVGANATIPPAQGWPVLLRTAYAPNSVAMEAFGFRSLALDAPDAPGRAALVATLASYSPSIIWLAIGTNDYGLNKWTAADFGAAYAALLDDLNAALPGVEIYCQTPLVRTSEGANSLGDTLPQYRTAISDAVSTRTAFATLVDGTAILTAGDLADGVHPSTAGHALYADAVIAALP